MCFFVVHVVGVVRRHLLELASFDVVFGFEFDEDLEGWGVCGLSADELPEFKFVGCCADFEADESADWSYELNNRLCPFDMCFQMEIDGDVVKQALALDEHD